MRPFNSYVTLRPREDLEQLWNSCSIISPESAIVSAEQMTGERHDRACIGEVIAVGEGTADFPDMTAVKPGDIVVLPLFSVSKVIVLDKEIGLLAEMASIAGVVTDLGAPTEAIRAVNNFVLTRRDREAFERRMYGGLLLPEGMLADGMPVDGGSDGIVRLVLERVMSAGGGVRLKRALWTPKQRKGDLIGLNPIASCRFRRLGTFFRLTPSEDCQFAVED